MFKLCKAVVAAAILAIGLGAGSAQALPFITGSITVADGLKGLPGPGSTSVVSALLGIQHDGAGVAFGCTTNFVGSCPGAATMTDWTFAPPPFPVIISINGFKFDLLIHGAITDTPLTCQGGSCSDTLTVANLVGVVSKVGFADTAFTGSLALTGTCVGAAGKCISDISGGYTYSLSATGKETVPEPGTLLLIGVAIAGLGFARRKSA